MKLPIPVAAVEMPVAVDEFLKMTQGYAKAHQNCTWREVSGWLVIFTEGDPCRGCLRCETFELEAMTRLTGDPLFAIGRRTFMTCPDCGNKRCPRATDHDYECSGSNEPGQLGSAYART